jgi:hypothetical protein
MRLDDKGRPTSTRHFLAFPNSVLFSLQIYAKNHGAAFQVDRSTSGWRALRDAMRLRDKVTHPKSSASLEVSEDDVEVLKQASQWWQETLMSLFTACHQADAHWRDVNEQSDDSSTV